MAKDYTLQEAEEISGIPRATLRRKCDSGEIKGILVKKGMRDTWRIPPAELTAWINRQVGGSYEDFYNEWIRDLESGYHTRKPQAPKTVSNLEYGMAKFWHYLALPKSLDAISAENLRRSIANVPVDYEKKSDHFSQKEMMYKSVCSFYQLLIRKGLRRQADLEDLKPEKPKKRVFPIKRTLLQKPQLKKLLDKNESLRGRSDFDVCLGKTIIYLGVYAGLRRNDLLRLELSHVDLENSLLYVDDGKGHKNRTIGIRPKLWIQLKDWLNIFRPKAPFVNFLLKADGFPITKSVLQNRYRRWQNSTGIKINTHGARRSFVTLSADEGVPVPHLQLQAGHTNIKTTMDYMITDELVAADSLRNLDGGMPKLKAKRKPKKRTTMAKKLEEIKIP